MPSSPKVVAPCEKIYAEPVQMEDERFCPSDNGQSATSRTPVLHKPRSSTKGFRSGPGLSARKAGIIATEKNFLPLTIGPEVGPISGVRCGQFCSGVSGELRGINTEHQASQTPGNPRDVKFRPVRLFVNAIVGRSFPFRGRVILVDPVDDFLQSQMRHNETPSQDLTRFCPLSFGIAIQ
jgi:hypothetical protein